MKYIFIVCLFYVMYSPAVHAAFLLAPSSVLSVEMKEQKHIICTPQLLFENFEYMGAISTIEAFYNNVSTLVNLALEVNTLPYEDLSEENVDEVLAETFLQWLREHNKSQDDTGDSPLLRHSGTSRNDAMFDVKRIAKSAYVKYSTKQVPLKDIDAYILREVILHHKEKSSTKKVNYDCLEMVLAQWLDIHGSGVPEGLTFSFERIYKLPKVLSEAVTKKKSTPSGEVVAIIPKPKKGLVRHTRRFSLDSLKKLKDKKYVPFEHRNTRRFSLGSEKTSNYTDKKYIPFEQLNAMRTLHAVRVVTPRKRGTREHDVLGTGETGEEFPSKKKFDHDINSDFFF